MNNDAGWTSNVGDITGVTAGTNLTGGGTSGTVTLNMATGGIGSGTYGSTDNGTKIDTITVDAYGRVTAVATGDTGDIQGVTAGNGLTGGGTTGTPTLNVGAGTGISVQADTVTNTGVLSVNGVTGAVTATNLLDAIKTVDGSGSGLDADLLDGISSGGCARYSSGGTLGDALASAAWVTNYGGSGNIDHIWHDDTGNNWHFCSDTTFKATGNSGLICGSVSASGDITSNSDERLKDNIEIIGNAIDRVSQISGVSYTLKDAGTRHAGVIAQEVEKVLPEVVHENAEGIKSVAYGNMVGLLIEAIKEQQASIEKLEARVAELEA